MMNRKPSGAGVLGKYALLIGSLYISSAFVAPYQREIARLIPETSAPIDYFLAETENSRYGKKQNNEVVITELTPIDQNIVGQKELKTKSKWVVIKGDTLYWTISPLQTWEDINLIKQDIKAFGSNLSINRIEYDPLQKYITSLAVQVESDNGSASSSHSSLENYKPARAFSGFIIKNGEFGMGNEVPAALSGAGESDYENALSIYKENEVPYFEKQLASQFQNHSEYSLDKTAFFDKRASAILAKDGLGATADKKLLITDTINSSDLYLNAKAVDRDELSSLPMDQIISIKIIQGDDQKKSISIRRK